MFKALIILTQKEIRMIFRQSFSWLTPLLFFILVVCLFPLAIGIDSAVLQQIAPGIIWIAALLAILISIGNLFQNDANDGFLDLLLLSTPPLTLIVACKILSHWLTHCLPLILISPLLGFLLHLRAQDEVTLVVTLFLGTPILSMFGALGAALTVGIRSGGLLLPLLIMPLYIPVLIFGTGTLLIASANQPVYGYLAIMGALLLLSAAFAPLFTAIALRIGVNQ